MAQIMTFRGDHGNSAMPVNWRIEVRNRTELDNLVKDLRNAGYRTFALKSDEGQTVVEMDAYGVEWYNTSGFRI